LVFLCFSEGVVDAGEIFLFVLQRPKNGDSEHAKIVGYFAVALTVALTYIFQAPNCFCVAQHVRRNMAMTT